MVAVVVVGYQYAPSPADGKASGIAEFVVKPSNSRSAQKPHQQSVAELYLDSSPRSRHFQVSGQFVAQSSPPSPPPLPPPPKLQALDLNQKPETVNADPRTRRSPEPQT